MAPSDRDSADLWLICADTGGTFTDVVGRDPSGLWHRLKVLSSSRVRGRVVRRIGARRIEVEGGWPSGDGLLTGASFRLLSQPPAAVPVVARDDARGRVLELDGELPAGTCGGAAFGLGFEMPPSVLGARLMTGTAAGARLPPLKMRIGTTLATNALLTGGGAPTVFFVTRGLADLLVIGTQQRADIFALVSERCEAPYCGVVEIHGRVAADGRMVEPLDLPRLEKDASRWLSDGARCAAVALLHADRFPDHERQVAACLRDLGFEHVSCSHEMARAIGLLPRAQTSVVDASLAPVVSDHLSSISASIGSGSLRVMTSAGGLVAGETARPRDLLLSGPAAGVVGAVDSGRRSRAESLIGFDMGGTSTDVARWDGDFDYVFSHRVGQAEIVAPALDIHSVAAGGGSICDVDSNGLRVGPASAGARPGPACYGDGGPLTLTDVNLLLGRLDSSRFRIPIDEAAARDAAETLLDRLGELHGERPRLDALLEGLLEVANERMAAAIREISVRRGVDPAGDALVAFGGAGGQHACAVASRLGITRVIVPGEAGLLSARGLAEAVIERFAERQVLAPVDEVAQRLGDWLSELEASAIEEVVREGVDRDAVTVRRRIASLRFSGQDAPLEIDLAPPGPAATDPAVAAGRAGEMRDRFLDGYRAVYGYAQTRRPIELVSLRVIASERAVRPRCAEPPSGGESLGTTRIERARFAGAWRDVPLADRSELAGGRKLEGPCLVSDPFSTTVVEEEWTVVGDDDGALHLTRGRRAPGRTGGTTASATRGDRPGEVELELFTNRFGTIAREMGRALERTAVSTNVKERLDFSCALLDEAGMLVVNAPHVPVHLGSLGLCVRTVAGELRLEPGDVAITNHPAYGGSHLPDVTVIEPSFAADPGGPPVLVGYVAARAHHAEIGGTRPGSMPPRATRLSEEGVVIPPMYLFRHGEPRWDALTTLLRRADHPSRALEDNLADARAAVAACRQGAARLAGLAERYGTATVRHFMEKLAERAHSRLVEELRARPEGRAARSDRLDDGTPIAVAVETREGRLLVDFRGSAGVHPGNLNATPAIVRSVVLYVLRLLIREPLPLNEGLMRAVDLVLEPGLLDPPFPADPRKSPAVVGGNVETSQRLVNLLLDALGLAAASQGTMNNTLFGDDRSSYYETVCGGCGAGPGFDGPSAVHSHMTNTRITDPELLEARYPVRLRRFAVREGSGGAGRWHGGDGVVREIEFLARQSLSLLTQHRDRGPGGMDGGECGARGSQRVLRADGRVESLGAIDETEMAPGDRLILETPGGGGWGAPDGGDGS
jgi:5-oxoprolinase (ATP-hydrolysing)